MTRKNQCFNPELTKCVYELLNQHVGVAKISSCIETVITNLTKKKCQRLPSETTIKNMSIQRLCIAQEQLSSELSAVPNTTLYMDETSKYGEKVMGYHISNSDKRYFVLGLRDIATKSAVDYV